MQKTAKTKPQTCGNLTSPLFDLRGLASFIRRTFPDNPGYNVEARTGIAAATVENWLQSRSRPSAEHFSILLCVFGPAFMRACIITPPKWLDAACDWQRKIEIENQIVLLETERAAIDRLRAGEGDINGRDFRRT